MTKEEGLIQVIEYMDKVHGNLNGLDKAAILKTVASYFENITAAEAQKETFKKIYKNIAG